VAESTGVERYSVKRANRVQVTLDPAGTSWYLPQKFAPQLFSANCALHEAAGCAYGQPGDSLHWQITRARSFFFLSLLAENWTCADELRSRTPGPQLPTSGRRRDGGCRLAVCCKRPQRVAEPSETTWMMQRQKARRKGDHKTSQWATELANRGVPISPAVPNLASLAVFPQCLCTR